MDLWHLPNAVRTRVSGAQGPDTDALRGVFTDDAVLVDEYQNTTTLQGEIVTRSTASEEISLE